MHPLYTSAHHIHQAGLLAADVDQRRAARLGHIRNPRPMRRALRTWAARIPHVAARQSLGWALIRTGMRFVEPLQLIDRARR